MIAIIDYGAGNLQSVVKALRFIGCDTCITHDRGELLAAEGAILPGVGSFGDSMDCLNKSGMKNAVYDYIETKRPFLGICLGLQMLFEQSEESPGVLGLGILKGSIRRIPAGEGLKIPHIGWNSLSISRQGGLYTGISGSPYVYFVHSYYLLADNRDEVSAQTEYGVPIDASVESGNIFATQFHPEKSGDVGLKMLRNFAAMTQEKR
jgi:glutamine amidotransferase